MARLHHYRAGQLVMAILPLVLLLRATFSYGKKVTIQNLVRTQSMNPPILVHVRSVSCLGIDLYTE